MPEVSKRLAGPSALTGSAATVYTVPASTNTVVKMLSVCNTSTSSVAWTLSIGVDVTGTRLHSGTLVPGTTTWHIPVWHHLSTGEVIQSFAGTAGVLVLTVSGVELS